jgi:hypothetical protein
MRSIVAARGVARADAAGARSAHGITALNAIVPAVVASTFGSACHVLNKQARRASGLCHRGDKRSRPAPTLLPPHASMAPACRLLPLLPLLLLLAAHVRVASAALQYDYLNVYGCPPGHCLDKRCAAHASSQRGVPATHSAAARTC